MMNPAWLSHPIKVSSSLWVILSVFSNVLMAFVHATNLLRGKEIISRHVSMIHPSMIWHSAGVTLANSFFKQRMSLQGRLSLGNSG